MPPDGSVGEEHEENAVLSQGMNHLQIDDRYCFLNRSSVSVFAAVDLFFLFSSNYFLFFPAN